MTATNLTGSEVIATAWPARYYAAYDTTATGVTLVTALYDVQSAQTVVQNLPAAATMIALTEDQWTMANGAKSIWVQSGSLLYPARYYASYDTTAAQPTPVVGWYDTWGLSSVSDVPAASSMLPISASDWANTTTFHIPTRGVQDGKIIDYTPPAAPVPLATQAQSALASARQTVWDEYGSLNETTPDNWVTYLKALMAIANGTDTTSQALPVHPADGLTAGAATS